MPPLLNLGERVEDRFTFRCVFGIVLQSLDIHPGIDEREGSSNLREHNQNMDLESTECVLPRE